MSEDAGRRLAQALMPVSVQLLLSLSQVLAPGLPGLKMSMLLVLRVPLVMHQQPLQTRLSRTSCRQQFVRWQSRWHWARGRLFLQPSQVTLLQPGWQQRFRPLQRGGQAWPLRAQRSATWPALKRRRQLASQRQQQDSC